MTTAALCPYLRYPSNLRCLLPDSTLNPPVGKGDVIILDHLSSQSYEWAALGASVLVLSSGDGSLDPLQTLQQHYHPSWWYGNPTSSSMGTVVYEGFDAIAPGMAPEGWCDAGWVKLIDESRAMMLDDFGGSSSVDVLIRAIDLLGTGQSAATPQDSPFRALARDKILLWQAGIDGPAPPPGPPPAPQRLEILVSNGGD